jgi:hypothetical protein
MTDPELVAAARYFRRKWPAIAYFVLAFACAHANRVSWTTASKLGWNPQQWLFGILSIAFGLVGAWLFLRRSGQKNH